MAIPLLSHRREVSMSWKVAERLLNPDPTSVPLEATDAASKNNFNDARNPMQDPWDDCGSLLTLREEMWASCPVSNDDIRTAKGWKC